MGTDSAAWGSGSWASSHWAVSRCSQGHRTAGRGAADVLNRPVVDWG